MLQPKKVKYRKVQKGKIKGLSKKGFSLAFGSYGLKTLEPGWITAKQIETIRVTVAKVTKKQGKFWTRIFPDKPITKKPAEVRMGKGKGNPEYWVSVVKPGRVLIEVDGISKEAAQEVFRLVSHKLQVRTMFVERLDLKYKTLNEV